MKKAGALHVLYEDNHCMAVIKPAGMPTAGDRTGDVSLLDLVRRYVKEKYRKPGRVFLGLVHRLDRPVSGVVLFARTSKAAARLSAQFRAGTIRKTYRAWVEGEPSAAAGEWTDWLVKDRARNVARVVVPNSPGARHAALAYRTLEATAGAAHLELRPHTGRAHQIRIQLARRGHPILGDVKYGARRTQPGWIALHALELTFDHPVRHEPVTIRAPEPGGWRRLLGPS
jgi:23S rRNA pseudouridine1911/1915/1917 synthase